MNRNLSVWNSLRPFSVGFDSIFDEFDRMLESTERYSSNYPPYNIKRVNDTDYRIEVALAGYGKDDIEIELKDSTLAVRNKATDKTIDEKVTGKLVDVLSSDQYPRTNARNLEREFRREPETAKEKFGKSFLVQGDVLIAGTNDANEKFVTFKAGKGQVTCIFANITDEELLRFTPAGTNSVTGTVENWDSENRILTLTDCNVVLGY